jgi:transposase
VEKNQFKKLLGKDPPASTEDQNRQKEVWDREMAELVEHFSQFRELEKSITYLRNGLGDWYTCLLYPGM